MELHDYKSWLLILNDKGMQHIFTGLGQFDVNFHIISLHVSLRNQHKYVFYFAFSSNLI